MSPRARDKVLKAVRPNAGIESEYRQRLGALIRDMQASYEYWIRAQYRKTPPIAMDADIRKVTAWEGYNWTKGASPSPVWFVYVDGTLLRGPKGLARWFRSSGAAEEAGLRAAGSGGALTKPLPMSDPDWARAPFPSYFKEVPTPAVALEQRLAALGEQWGAEFGATAPKLARWFAETSGRRSQDGLKKILRDGGVSVRFEMTPAVRDIVEATVSENVGLIKSIASEYHSEVQGMVMRSVAAGRDLGMLTRELEGRYDITRRRAAKIALDQNNKATSDIVRVRQAENGLLATWLHSAGGKKPRKTHVANSGKVYDPKVGWFDPDPKVQKRIWPGQLINCRCVSRTVVRGFS